jgi:hypothetical protein
MACYLGIGYYTTNILVVWYRRWRYYSIALLPVDQCVSKYLRLQYFFHVFYSCDPGPDPYYFMKERMKLKENN